MNNTRQDTLAKMIESTDVLFTRFLAGFDDSNRTRQPDGLPNHVAWTLGHCGLTMHRVAERFDGKPLPESDYIRGDGTQGDHRRYDTESICIGSTPVDDPQRYPTLARGREIYQAACARFAHAVRDASDEQLDATIPWHDGAMRLWQLVMRVCFHNGSHAGQLIDLRRGLGLPRIIIPRSE